MTYTPSPTIDQFFSQQRNLHVQQSPSAEFAKTVEQDQDIEYLFFSRLRLSNGVFKTTARRRLDDVNERILKQLPRDQTLRVMDVAVSSGISTLEWAQALKQANFVFEMTAGDLTIAAKVTSLGRVFQVLVDSHGDPLQIDILGIAFPNASGSRVRNACFEIGKCLVRGMFCLPLKTRPLWLVTPALTQSCNSITLVEDDILIDQQPEFQRRFDVLRAANILNRSYFDIDTLQRMTQNLKQRLVVGGLLVICRTDENQVNHGIIIRLCDGETVQVLDRFGDRAELESLVV